MLRRHNIQALRRRCMTLNVTKIKGTRVCEGGGTSSWTGSAQHHVGKSIQDLSDAASKCSSQYLSRCNIHLLYPFLFLFYFTKASILLCHFLSSLSYWVPERILHHYSLPLIFYLFPVQNKDADIIHTQKFYKYKHRYHYSSSQVSVQQQSTTATNLFFTHTTLLKRNSTRTLVHITNCKSLIRYPFRLSTILLCQRWLLCNRIDEIAHYPGNHNFCKTRVAFTVAVASQTTAIFLF